MFDLRLEGMDTVKVSEKIDIPFSFIEMLRSPWGNRIDAEDLYKYGGEINRYLLSKTPLSNNKKYTICYVSVVYLTPQTISVPTVDWHVDGSNVPYLAEDQLHTMICTGENISGQLRTEFLKEGRTISVPDNVGKMNHLEFRRWITDRKDEYGIEGVHCEEGVINTWTSRHLHRVMYAEKPHFRFFWKVAESDTLTPLPREDSIRPNSKVMLGDYGSETLNIEQGGRGIILRGIKYKY